MSQEPRVEQMPLLVGRRVRDTRTARGLTLDQLADSSGVSRRMIINVEAGTSNASITTLLRLANALHVPLADLVSAGSGAASCRVTSPADREPLWRGPHGGTADLVASADALELWDWTLQPDETYESEPHRPGTRELLHVRSGRLALVIAGEVHELRAGDGAGFAADVSHSYGCHGRRPVRFAMTVLEPMTRARP